MLRGTLHSKLDLGEPMTYIFTSPCPEPPEDDPGETTAIVIVFIETNKMVDRFAPTDLHLVCDRLHTKLFLILNVKSYSLSLGNKLFFFRDSLLLEEASTYRG